MVISHERIADALEVFIRRDFRVGQNDPLFGRRVHLYDAGFVDSTGVVELIAFVEEAFSVTLQDEHIFSDAFTTIDGISGIVHACLAEMPADDELSCGTVRHVSRSAGVV